MPPPLFSSEELTLLFHNTDGDPDALREILPCIYDELRELAHHHLAGEGRRRMLNTTALVHEAYLKLEAQGSLRWENRAHFFGVAARAMRCILVDHARRARASRRGGDHIPLSLDAVDIALEDHPEAILALDEALERLGGVDDRKARVVEYRFFAGLTIEETADALNLSPATIKNDWRFAKAWLYTEMTAP